MGLLNDTGIAISTAILIFGLALGLPHINIDALGLNFSQFPFQVLVVLRIGLIGLALSIGLKPLHKKRAGIR